MPKMPKKASPRIQSVSLKRSSEGQLLLLWGATEKEIPSPPEKGAVLTPQDSKYWYDTEYAGWNIEKINIPDSPRDGASGKELIYLQPGDDHPYMQQYAATIEERCADAGLKLRILNSKWDEKLFDDNVNMAISMKPDMILLNPEHQKQSSSWYKRINEADIPVIGGNFLAENEGHKYLLAWTGPDDWGQSRLLAKTMADQMNHKGGYAIIQHHKGNSSYFARTWGPITELNKYTPDLIHLDSRIGMIPSEAAAIVEEWIDTHGDGLNGIFSADDGEVMQAISEVLKKRDREDICCVAAGSSRMGLEHIMQDRLYANSFQSPEIDAETAIQTIIDWFEGLTVEPIRYLPKYIVTKEDASEFMYKRFQVSSLNMEHLYNSIREYKWRACYNFFGDLYEKILTRRVIPIGMFQGICLEILTGMIVIMQEDGLSVEENLGSYSSLAKHLTEDQEITSVLEWLNDLAQQVIASKLSKINKKTHIQEIVDFIDKNYSTPMSLKSLSYDFSISQAYLGQIFRKETGLKFNDYINDKRIEEAKKLFRGENIVINKVALQLGYTDPAYFYKLFKKRTGMSAMEYIQKQSD
ncbi:MULTISPECIES: substrate-binding domain-containing protein [unclassified Oceanispirochaeta]|nr:MULTISPECIES: substrate-binding domain-containing protein [unclassified Oceanispirochaeta]MBF9014856.1 substrate-binding domain-containing protein [Oceanispirochaeta sp. M2]NPD71463.1 substrate-binding domain-containing protein [Oceanispirochaeta sp. M1]RDG33424.1 AraC family transcriptional regulator [Oceanispirochaeta sp. M1]